MLSEKLGYEVSSIGSMKRETAKEMGMTIQEFDNLSEEPGNAKKFDEKYENDRKSLNLQQNIILEARTGFYVQPKSFKVLLDVSKEEAGKRVFEAHRDSEVAYKTVEEAISATVLRQEKVETRLKKLYGIDIYEYKNFDLVIDTTERTPAEVFEIILNEFKTWKIKKLKS
jgi:cytidylate kinase